MQYIEIIHFEIISSINLLWLFTGELAFKSLKANSRILSCTIKYKNFSYVEVSSSLSNSFAITWGTLHNATFQANLIIFYLPCG